MGELEGASTNFTAYVNPYTVINNGNQMSKHIYVGTQRIVSKLCVAGAMADPTTATKATYTGSTLKYVDKYKALTATVKVRYDSLGVAYNGVDNNGATFYKASSSTPSGAGGSYYYHSDHLGSANYITDETGSVAQHLEYIPYGETFVDERYSTWHSPYKFNGKERDEETGLTYYSQRYFDGNVWYTSDELKHKHPNIGSYVYCAGNPVKYIDPDGRDWIYNNKEGYQWNDKVTSTKNTPKEYQYIGAKDKDILTHMGLSSQYASKTSNNFGVGFVGGDDKAGGPLKEGIPGSSLSQTSANITINADVSYNGQNKTDNNILGRKFEGITITANVSERIASSSEDIAPSSAGVFQLETGKSIYTKGLSEPTGSYYKESGTTTTTGSIQIPAFKLTPSNFLNSATITIGHPDQSMLFSTPTKIEFNLQNRQMIRPKK